jgi:hypothetical protein
MLRNTKQFLRAYVIQFNLDNPINRSRKRDWERSHKVPSPFKKYGKKCDDSFGNSFGPNSWGGYGYGVPINSY